MHQTTRGGILTCVMHDSQPTCSKQHGPWGGGDNMKWQMRGKANSITVWKVATQRRERVTLFLNGTLPAVGWTHWSRKWDSPWAAVILHKSCVTEPDQQKPALWNICSWWSDGRAANCQKPLIWLHQLDEDNVFFFLFFFIGTANGWLGERLSYVGQSSPGGGCLCLGVYTEVLFVLICL